MNAMSYFLSRIQALTGYIRPVPCSTNFSMEEGSELFMFSCMVFGYVQANRTPTASISFFTTFSDFFDKVGLMEKLRTLFHLSYECRAAEERSARLASFFRNLCIALRTESLDVLRTMRYNEFPKLETVMSTKYYAEGIPTHDPWDPINCRHAPLVFPLPPLGDAPTPPTPPPTSGWVRRPTHPTPPQFWTHPPPDGALRRWGQSLWSPLSLLCRVNYSRRAARAPHPSIKAD